MLTMRRRGALVLAAFALACAHAGAADNACPARHDGQPLVTGQVLDGPLADNAILGARFGHVARRGRHRALGTSATCTTRGGR